MAQNKSPDKPEKSDKPDDGKKKRSALAAILLILLLVLILLLLFYAGGILLGKGNDKGKGKNDAGAIGTTNIGTTGTGTDTLGANGTIGTNAIDTNATGTNATGTNAKGTNGLGNIGTDVIGTNATGANAANTANNADAADNPAKNMSQKADSLRLANAQRKADSLSIAVSIADSLRQMNLRREADSVRAAESQRVADSLSLAASNKRIADSLGLADSVAKLSADSAALHAARCARDTLAPWVYADPSGGLHRAAVSVKLAANKACRVEWSFDGAKGWKVYDGKPIGISKNATLYYKAVDGCGKKMDVRSKRYEFDMSASRCPAGMELVKAPGREICVDVYEWPNKKGVAPRSYVSLYQAMDSCFSVRKRLCASEEWTAACGGPERWKYAYGESYEWNACSTRDSMVSRSGAKPECRGYYGLFDMSGNLAEWTSTPAPQDKSFNNVMGGFWTSGDQSRCADARYSYYPQNRHNPVGFRCCVDAPPAAGGGR